MNLQQAIDQAQFHTRHFPSSFYPRESAPRSLDIEARAGETSVAVAPWRPPRTIRNEKSHPCANARASGESFTSSPSAGSTACRCRRANRLW